MDTVTSTDIIIGSLMAGPIISLIVSALKRIALVKQYPKAAAALLSSVIPAAIVVYGRLKGVDVASLQQLVIAIATQFAAAVTTHEAVVQPVKDAMADDDGDVSDS